MNKVLMLHDCAGVNYDLSKLLEKRGFNVDLYYYSTGPDPYVDYGDHIIRGGKIKRSLHMMSRLLHNYDIVHLVSTRFPNHQIPYDYVAAKMMGSRVVVHFHGQDLRVNADKPAIKYLLKNKTILLSTPDLLEQCPSGHWLPNPVSSERFKPVESMPHDGVRVLHSSTTSADIKGTAHLIKAVNELRGEGYEVDLRILGGPPYGTPVPREDMPDQYHWADIVVNEILLPLHSLVTIEAMLCAKPVLSSFTISREVCDPPLWVTSKSTLTNDLRQAIDNLEEYKKKAAAGRGWAIEHHDPERVVDQLIKYYEEA